MSLLTGNKDVDLKIFSELDDISLLNFCRENQNDEYIKKLCFDETFWRNRTISKYGMNGVKEIWKNPKRTWRNFYLKLTYYNNEYHPNSAMMVLAKDGSKNLDLIDFFMHNSSQSDMEYVLYGAAEGNHMDLVDFSIDKGANDWDGALISAASGGNKDMVKFFINKGATENLERGMLAASRNGHKELLEFFKNLLGY